MRRSSVLLVLAVALVGCSAQGPAGTPSETPSREPVPAWTVDPAEDVPTCETFFSQVEGYTSFVDGAVSEEPVSPADLEMYGEYIAALKEQASYGTGGDVIDYAIPYDAIKLAEATGTDLYLLPGQFETARDAIADFCVNEAGVNP